MKLSTLALGSTLGMTLTSVSVWALTPSAPTAPAWSAAKGSTEAGPDRPSDSLAGLLGVTAPGAQFESGKTLTLAGRLGHPTLASAGGETYLYFDVKASEGVATKKAPLNLSIVIDRSRSMEGQRMQNAIEGARGMIRRLNAGDTVSVVTYNTDTEVLVPATTIDEDTRARVLFSLRDVEARGHTCVSCGIEAGLQELQRGGTGVSRMLLLSDGEANAGIRDLEGFRALADRAYAEDVSISSVGVDVDYNEQIMFAVAQASNGRHHFVRDPSDLAGVFDQELADLVKTVANDARVEIELDSGVQLLEVYDRSFRREGDRIVVPLGAFAASDEKTVLLRVRVPGGDAGRHDVATVRMSYDDLVQDERGECDGRLAAELTTDPRAVSELDSAVETRLARAETVSALSVANEQFARGEVAAAQRTIEDNRGRIRSRRDAAKKKAPAPALERLDKDFERQLDTLDKAEQGFSEAAQTAPAEPSQSRAGKAQIRSNVDEAFSLGL
jgi:Ca-activated chloride channel family protein